MGHVSDGLHDLAELDRLTLVQDQGEENRQRERKDEHADVDGQGVPDQTPQIDAVEEFLELSKTDPLRSEDALHGFEILKGDDDAVHRPIVEDDIVGEDRQEHQIQIRMLLNIAEKAAMPADLILITRTYRQVICLSLTHRYSSYARFAFLPMVPGLPGAIAYENSALARTSIPRISPFILNEPA